jgi:hypothetical protein
MHQQFSQGLFHPQGCLYTGSKSLSMLSRLHSHCSTMDAATQTSSLLDSSEWLLAQPMAYWFNLIPPVLQAVAVV